ncbi:hypothetical protein K2173_004619 [Erythroxylum novogranatense]|uniref:RING-type domain-containing protein n=1 Tax=Erythroxylum novogranatense TaxID=1862640 RepID=A0AAV8U821_9ROSI|nr:hypothetical protein K2173_004619 [Erythroxylum novogranatense]
MAVEARHLNLFPPQLLGNREMMNSMEANANIYSPQMGYGVPLSGTTTTTETFLPTMYSSVITESVPHKTSIKSESGLTYSVPAQRKRSRDNFNPPLAYPTPQSTKTCAPFSFLGEDLSLEIQQHQLDVDHLIYQHMEKVRIEMEDKRKRQASRIMEAIEEGIMKRLKAKEEEVEKIGKLNWALEERVKSLCVENQIWRDLAQSNEATANALRSNLEQVLSAQVKDEHTRGARLEEEEEAAAVMEDAQSCCDSSNESAERWRLGNRVAQDKGKTGVNRVCRNCRDEEACVLLLPCRHLCLCTACGSNLNICPICKTTKNGSFHVNMS